jgi:hypothetical protein
VASHNSGDNNSDKEIVKGVVEGVVEEESKKEHISNNKIEDKIYPVIKQSDTKILTGNEFMFSANPQIEVGGRIAPSKTYAESNMSSTNKPETNLESKSSG